MCGCGCGFGCGCVCVRARVCGLLVSVRDSIVDVTVASSVPRASDVTVALTVMLLLESIGGVLMPGCVWSGCVWSGCGQGGVLMPGDVVGCMVSGQGVVRVWSGWRLDAWRCCWVHGQWSGCGQGVVRVAS